MLDGILPVALTVLAYLLGSVSTAIITCKVMGLPDPRTVGSKNPGATNVLRHGGKKAAFFTLLGDLLKGFVPVIVAKLAGLESIWIMAVGLAAFLGHVYPIYFKLRGGKGVATAIGVYLGINWLAGLLIVATWLFVAKVLKISSLSALIATLLAPIFFYFTTHDVSITTGIAVMTVLIFWRHRSNIQNIIEGKENRIGPKS